MTAGGRLSPHTLYPLPVAAPDGPLIRAVAGARSRWAAGAARLWGGRRLRAEGAAVAARAAACDGISDDARRERLRAVRPRLRRMTDDAHAQREALALAGACWSFSGEAPPTPVEYAAALAVMRGRLAELGDAPDPERVALLAALGLAPWGGGVHLVCGRPASEVAQRLARLAEPLGLSVGVLEPGTGAAAHRAAWQADITCTGVGNLVTDALRDVRVLQDRPGDLRLRVERLHGVTPRAHELCQRGLRYGVLLDAGRLLLDEALRTVALSADDAASQELQALALAWDVSALFEPGSAWVDEACRLTDAGRARLAEMLAQRGGPWSSPAWREQRVGLALLARHALISGEHYDASGPQIQPLQPAFGARLSSPLEQRLALDMLAIRHGREVPRSGTPVASMSFMEAFLRYSRLGGVLPATDALARRELRELYGLVVVPLAEASLGSAAAGAAGGAPESAPSPAERALMVRARAEHRQAAGRLHKLLAFTGG